MGYRFDNFYTRLGKHNDCGRIWVEDSYDRLSRNNFMPGTSFSVKHRGGAGLVVSAAILGTCSISRRGKVPLFSYESRELASRLACTDVRLKISVGQILIVPLLRAATVATADRTEEWSVEGPNLLTPRGVVLLDQATPLSLNAGSVRRINAHLTELNLVAVTEYIARVRVPEVKLAGTEFLCGIARQFFADCGYAPDADGLLRR